MKRIWLAFLYSLAGLKAAWRDEPAFRQEMVLALVLLPVAFMVDASPAERALMVLSVFVVLTVELVNSAIEATIDRVGPEIHPLSKKAKDAGSAAVLISLIAAAAVWAIVLWK